MAVKYELQTWKSEGAMLPEMLEPLEPRCWKRGCVHVTGGKYLTPGDEGTEVWTCEAFPEGIPDEIAYGEDLHLEPLPGRKNSITYEAEPGFHERVKSCYSVR